MKFKENIAPELLANRVPIDSVQQHPDNARSHRLDKIMQSLEAHGQRALIVVQQSTGFIVKGNGTWRAAKQMGWEGIAASLQDLGDTEALAFLVADNRASDLATYDKEKHLAGLRKLVAGPGLMGTLFSDDEFADLDEEMTALTTIAPDSDAKHTHEFSETGAEVQGKREAGAQSDQERLKDVRFPLTLSDHAVFVERLKLLQKRFGTAGAIATIMETVKRQAEAEAGSPVVTGKRATEEGKLAAARSIAEEIKGTVITMGMEAITKAQLFAILDQLAPAPAAPAPEAKGQEAFPEMEAEAAPEPSLPLTPPEVLEPDAADSVDEAVTA